MITLGDLKTYLAAGTVNQGLNAVDSDVGKYVHWVTSDILSIADFWWNRGTDTFTTTNGTAQYFLNNQVFMDKIWGMYDLSNERKIEKKDIEDFYDYDPTPTDTGDPDYFAYVDQVSCQAVPTSAGTASAVSSSSADTSIGMIMKGKSSSIERYDTFTLNGATSVTGANSISFTASEPISINLQKKAAGVVTVTIGSVTVAQIPPGHLRVLRPRIRLFQVPGTTGDTIQYHFYKRSIPLVSDSDMVDLPDIAFKALRSGIEEIGYFLAGRLNASQLAFQKYTIDIKKLISVSERDIAGNEIKDYKYPVPFAYRLPDTITGSVS